MTASHTTEELSQERERPWSSDFETHINSRRLMMRFGYEVLGFQVVVSTVISVFALYMASPLAYVSLGLGLEICGVLWFHSRQDHGCGPPDFIRRASTPNQGLP